MNDSTSATSPVWPTRWPKNSFTGFGTWLLAGVIVSLLLVFVVLVARTGPIPKNISPLLLDLSIILQCFFEGLLVAIVLVALPSLSKFSLRELGFRAPSRLTLGVALLGAIVMALVADGSANLISYFTHSQHEQDIVETFKGLHDPTTISIFTVFAVLFAPFAEETLFRIFFFNLGLRFGGFWTGAVISGALFGLAHSDVFNAIPLALGGIVLCAVYYRTQNAFAPMISHALFNGFSTVALLFFPNLTK